MNAITTFDFDDANLRVVELADEPWFIAADVCAALGVDLTATRKLDEDEKGLHSMQTLGGAQQTTVINESGLYTLILRCRDAMTPGTVPHRFRKWVTGEVLPALRRRGHYGEPVRTFDQTDVPFMVATNNLLRTAIKLHGPRAARPLWEKFGLPPIDPSPGAMVQMLTQSDDEEDDGLSDLVAEWVAFHDGFSIVELAVGIGLTEQVPTAVKRRLGRILRLLGLEPKVERRGEMVAQVFRQPVEAAV